jgi:peptidoglycan/LPS O-acetylase OafA/YrhL
MFGWTALLLWAYRRPVERRFVAALTAIVVVGLIVAEIAAVYAGALEARRLVPTWCLQAALLVLFVGAYAQNSQRSRTYPQMTCHHK